MISLAGHFEKNEALSEIKRHFGRQKPQKTRSFVSVKEAQRKPNLRVVYKKTDQAHLVVGVRGLKIGHPDRYSAAILGTILGGGMSSRLFINVREKRGLAYYVQASHDSYLDTGTLAASAGVDIARIDEALAVILSEFAKICQEPVGQKELTKTKEYIKGRIILSWEDSRTVAISYGSDELMEGKIRTLDEYLKKIDEVNASDIQRVAKSLFVNSKLNLAVIGPFKDKTRFEKILKI